METAGQRTKDVQAELASRQKATALTVGALLVLTVALSIIAFLGKGLFRHQNNPSLEMAWTITILTFGVGSVVLRRTRFSTMRLQDIAALRGASGLLKTLQRTTLQIGLLGAAIAILGFVTTVMTGADFYAYRAGLVSLVVLFYCYPTKASWQRALQKFVTLGPEHEELSAVPPPE